jgi:biotin transport system substrate-specific component
MTSSARTRDIVLISLVVALTTAGAWLRIPLGPVPLSLQTLFVLLAGAVLGPMLGATAMGVYLVLGLIGLPVFTAGGGPGYLFSPTFGFLLSFPLSALVVGLFYRTDQGGEKTRRLRNFAAFVAGTGVIYLIGVPWLGLNLKFVQGKEVGFAALMTMGMVPFLPGDFMKILLAFFLAGPVGRMISYRNQ